MGARVGTDILVRPLKFQLTSRALGARPYGWVIVLHTVGTALAVVRLFVQNPAPLGRTQFAPMQIVQPCRSERSEESHMAQNELGARVGTDILVRPLKFQPTSRTLGARPYGLCVAADFICADFFRVVADADPYTICADLSF